MGLLNTIGASIDLEAFDGLSPEQKELCEILSKEIESKRSELMQSPYALCDGLFGKFNQFENMHWDEILSNDFNIISAIAEAKKIDRVEVLNCILLLNPPRWKEFFWRLQYEKISAEIFQFKFPNVPMKYDTPEVIAAKNKAQEEIRQSYFKEGERINGVKGGDGKKKYDKDGKQAAKMKVKNDWEKWQANPTDYKTKADFARDMLAHYEVLKSQKNIEDWCRKWEKESAT